MHFAQQAFFRCEKCTSAFYIDAAAFEDHAAAFVNGLPDAALELLVGFGDEGGVPLVIRILGPAVESEMVVSDFAGCVSRADGAGVAHPAAVGRNAEKIHGIKICSGLFQNGANAGFGGAVFDE